MTRLVALLSSFMARKTITASLLWLVLLFMSATQTTVAQPTDTLQYSLRHFNDENGLPQNSVKSIVPGASGFIWLATENGVVRFDGYGFNIYNKDNTGFESSRIYYLIPTGQPAEYFAVTDREQVGLIRKGGIRLIDNETVKKNIFLQGHLLSIQASERYSAIGLPNIFKEGVQFTGYNIPLTTDSWYAIDSGKVFLYRNHLRRQLAKLPGATVWNFFLHNNHLFYWGRKGPLVLDTANNTFAKTAVAGDILKDKTWKSDRRPDKIYWNAAAQQVFFYFNQTLYLVTASANGQLQTRCLLNHFNLPVNKVASVYYDSTLQQLYLGSITNGLFLFKRKQFLPVQIRREGQEVYYAQLAYDSNRVLTPYGAILSPHTRPKYLSLMNQVMRNADQYSMTTGPSGNIWMKNNKTLYCFDSTANELRGLWNYADHISQVYADTAGIVWVGFRARGLYRVLPGSNDPTLYVPGLKDISSMQRSGDVLWLGGAQGLHKLHIATGTIDTIKQFKGRFIRSLHVPKTDEVWITTYDEGFYLYSGEKLTRFPQDKHNYLTTTHCVIEDKKGFLWMTTNKGLFQAKKQDLLDFARDSLHEVFYLYYNKENGFNTNEFNGGCQPCAVTLKNGFVSLPSLSGLVWFNPDSLRIELPDKELFIDRLEMDQQLLPITDTLHLPRDFQQLKLAVTTPYFGAENNLRIEYAVYAGKNKKRDWLRVADNKTILLSTLAAGRHYLVIRKCNGFGRDNYTYKTLVLNVPPAYYETWWFQIGVLVLLVLAIWFYSAFRVKYVRRKNKMLEQRIAERTGELEQTLTALQLSEEQLRRQMRIHERLITAMAHDIKSPLKYMTDAAWSMVAKSNKQAGMEEMHMQARLLFESGTRIYFFTDNLLQYIKLYARQGIITMETVNLFNVVEEKVTIFKDIAATQGTALNNEVAADVQVHSNARLLGVIIHNIIDNAVKVTHRGEITITSRADGGQQHIIVSDNGPGMREELVAWCNANTNQADLPDYMGMGLLIVKELLLLVQGKLHVESAPGKGTAVHVILSGVTI